MNRLKILTPARAAGLCDVQHSRWKIHKKVRIGQTKTKRFSQRPSANVCKLQILYLIPPAWNLRYYYGTLGSSNLFSLSFVLPRQFFGSLNFWPQVPSGDLKISWFEDFRNLTPYGLKCPTWAQNLFSPNRKYLKDFSLRGVIFQSMGQI